MKQNKRLSTLFFMLLLSCIAWSQVAEVHPYYREPDGGASKRAANLAIQQMHDGVLLVRLPSHHKKIMELEERATDRRKSASYKRKYSKMLDETKEERNKFGIMVIGAFSEYYDFTDVYFIWDTTEFEQLTGPVYLDKYLAIDPQIQAPGLSNVFFAKHGSTNPMEGNRVRGLIICDANMDPMKGPFPYYIPFDFGPDTLRAVLFRNVSKADLLRKATERWNSDLDLYLEKATASNQ